MSPPSVAVAADPRLAAATIVWQSGETTAVTIVAKIVVELVHGAAARLLPPNPLATRDVHRDDSPTASVRVPCETAPFLERPEVVLTGTAHQPAGLPGTTRAVGLSVHRGREVVLAKALHVYGDRDARAPGVIARFQSMPVVYERALGGPGQPTNPVGVAASGAGSLPNIVDARRPGEPGGFGPIARLWPVRARATTGASRKDLEGTALTLPAALSPSYFNAAPLDQRVGRLSGDEWIVLDGLHALHARFQSCLPGVRVAAALGRRSDAGRTAERVVLTPDLLVIDADALTASLVFRGHARVAAADLADALALVALDRPGLPIEWPTLAELVRAPARESGEDDAHLATTVPLDERAHGAAAATPAAPYEVPAPRDGRSGAGPVPWAVPREPAPAPTGFKTMSLAVAAPPDDALATTLAPQVYVEPAYVEPAPAESRAPAPPARAPAPPAVAPRRKPAKPVLPRAASADDLARCVWLAGARVDVAAALHTALAPPPPPDEDDEKG